MVDNCHLSVFFKFKGDGVDCPRCGRQHPVPRAEPAAATAAAAAVGGAAALGAVATGAAGQGASASNLSYRRQGATWESFRCACGRVQQLSPTFSGHHIRCAACGRDIQILPG